MFALALCAKSSVKPMLRSGIGLVVRMLATSPGAQAKLPVFAVWLPTSAPDPGRQHGTLREWALTTDMWETQIEFLAPSSCQSKPQALSAFGKFNSRWELCLSLCSHKVALLLKRTILLKCLLLNGICPMRSSPIYPTVSCKGLLLSCTIL